MIAQAHEAKPLIFTKLKLGNATLLKGENIKEFINVKSEKLSVPLQSIKIIGQG